MPLTQIDVNGVQFKCIPISLNAVLNRAIECATVFAESRKVTFDTQSGSPDRDLVLACETLLVSALRAILETAVKFSGKGGTVRISGDTALESRRVIIESAGRSIPAPALSKFFDLFSITEAITPGGDLGVGNALAHRILSLFGASVCVANRDKPGVRFTISLKRCHSQRSESRCLFPLLW